MFRKTDPFSFSDQEGGSLLLSWAQQVVVLSVLGSRVSVKITKIDLEFKTVDKRIQYAALSIPG